MTLQDHSGRLVAWPEITDVGIGSSDRGQQSTPLIAAGKRAPPPDFVPPSLLFLAVVLIRGRRLTEAPVAERLDLVTGCLQIPGYVIKEAKEICSANDK